MRTLRRFRRLLSEYLAVEADRYRWILLASLLIAVTAAPSFAGMPSPLPDDVETIFRLADEPTQRIQVISFFLLALLFAALVVKLLWNGLRREFPKLPQISYTKSLLVTIAWGLLFCIVLVMISGARELMTPGAWKKTGTTYQLKDDTQTASEVAEP